MFHFRLVQFNSTSHSLMLLYPGGGSCSRSLRRMYSRILSARPFFFLLIVIEEILAVAVTLHLGDKPGLKQVISLDGIAQAVVPVDAQGIANPSIALGDVSHW